MSGGSADFKSFIGDCRGHLPTPRRPERRPASDPKPRRRGRVVLVKANVDGSILATFV